MTWIEKRIEEAWDWVRGLLSMGALSIGSGILTAYQHGEIASFEMLRDVIHDAALAAVPIMVGWLLMRNPSGARELRELKARLKRAAIE